MRPIRLHTVLDEGRFRRPRLRRDRVISSCGTGEYTELLDIALLSMRTYAQRHHFDLVAVRKDTAFGRPPVWSKLPIIYRLLQSYRLVVWLDADTIVVDPSRNIADELRPEKDIYIVEHLIQPFGRTANDGVMMLRAGPCAESLIAYAWNRSDLLHRLWRDNAAIMAALGYRTDPLPAKRERTTIWSERTAFLDVAYNSLPQHHPSPKPVINHYAGVPFEERRSGMLEAAGLR